MIVLRLRLAGRFRVELENVPYVSRMRLDFQASLPNLLRDPFDANPEIVFHLLQPPKLTPCPIRHGSIRSSTF